MLSCSIEYRLAVAIFFHNIPLSLVVAVLPIDDFYQWTVSGDIFFVRICRKTKNLYWTMKKKKTNKYGKYGMLVIQFLYFASLFRVSYIWATIHKIASDLRLQLKRERKLVYGMCTQYTHNCADELVAIQRIDPTNVLLVHRIWLCAVKRVFEHVCVCHYVWAEHSWAQLQYTNTTNSI